MAAFAQQADSYEWTRDGEVVEGQTSVTLTVTLSGTYTVAGVNEYGKGLASPPHRVDITQCAATIAGGATNVCPEERVMLIAESYDTSAFRWKKDGEILEGQTSATLYASESGSYTVTPIYRGVVGRESEAKAVTVAACSFVDVIAGEWDVDEKWIWTNDFYNGKHNLFIEKIDQTNIRIRNFTGEGIQDQVVLATVDNEGRTITIPYQPIKTDGSRIADVYLAGIVTSSAPIHSVNVGIGTLSVAGKGKGMTVTFPGTVEITPPKQTVAYTGTWQTLAFNPSTAALMGVDMVGMKTVWTKK